MRIPRICVAGIEPQSLTPIRPTTPKDDPITRNLLRVKGGPFGPGALVELGDAFLEGKPPEVEDHRITTKQVQHVEDLDDEEYLTILDRVSDEDPGSAFGPNLREIRPRKLAVPAGQGQCSLAVVRIEEADLAIEWGKLYLHLRTGSGKAKLRVTDARFYEFDDFALNRDLVMDVKRRLRGGVMAYAMLGLARALYDDDAEAYLHWVQCNGLCLADKAVADLP